MNKRQTIKVLRRIVMGSILTLGYSACSPFRPDVADSATIKEAWDEFSNPADSARTKVWWFHGETETTREGITADLEAYKRAGVGGVVYYDQVHGKGEHALPAFSVEWWEMLKFAASEAKRVGLSFEINLSNGYVAGGPWITKALSMQRLTASDTIIRGKQQFAAALPAPGDDEFWDIAVLAFPVPQNQWMTNNSQRPKVTCNLPGVSAEDFFCKKSRLTTIPPQQPGKSVYINLDFETSFTARSITYRVSKRSKASTGAMNVPGAPADEFYGSSYVKQPPLGQLEVSDDGINYSKVCDLKPIYQAAASRWDQKTVSFPAVTGRYFRLNLHDWCLAGDQRPEMALGNVTLSSRARIDQWEERAGFYSEYILKNLTPAYTDEEIIDLKTIVDLTSKMGTDGRLEWDVPEGDWVIMRFAHESTGGPSKHGRANLKGLECDKMSVEAVTTQWNNYAARMIDTLSAINVKPDGVIMDSNEAGAQNWTPGFEQEFLRRKGYDLFSYLPAMMGYIVGSVTETDAFLYDLRRTVADVISDNYFGTLQTLCNKAGVDFTAQATGNGLSLVADNLQAKGRVQKPQGEFWAKHIHGSYDIKEASSAAHIYGKRIASAEAYTDAKFSQSLAELKNLADFAYAAQVNEFVVCASAYQPWLDKYPGSTGGGRHYCLNRNNTYWEYSRPFWDYQARCAGLMRKGMPVVDLCIYVGQNPPVKLLTYRLPEIPEGYDWDVCTSEALTTRMSTHGSKIALPDGMCYKMLVVQRNNDMPLHVLRHIAQLIEQGGVVYAPRPDSSASLKDKVDSVEYKKIVDQLWGKADVVSGKRSVGKGTLYWGMSLAEALRQAGIRPDMGIVSGNTPTDKVYFAHRRLADADVYFVDNHSQRSFKDEVVLRTSLSNASYWDPVTGKRYRLQARLVAEGLHVNITLLPGESGFIVVSDDSQEELMLKPTRENERLEAIKGDWQVYFDPRWGGPGEVVFPVLTDWTKHADSGIRYYSGTAVYRKKINLGKAAANEEIILRFDSLNSIGRVWLNGQEVSTVWCTPWEANLTPFVKNGENKLEIEVVNSLMNRMIGDASLPESKRLTYSYPEIAKSTDGLVPSGITGEVWLVRRFLQCIN